MSDHSKPAPKSPRSRIATATTDETPLLTIAADRESATPGQRVTYALGLVGCPERHFESLRVVCTLPETLRFLSGSAGTSYSAADRSLSWTVDSLGDGADAAAEVIVEVQLQSQQLPSIQIAGSVHHEDFAPIDVLTPPLTIVIPRVTLEHTANVQESSPGDALLYTLLYQCSGVATSGPARLRMQLPPHCRLVSASNEGAASEMGEEVVWDLGVLAPGTSGQVVVTVRVDSELPAGSTALSAQGTLEAVGLLEAVVGPPVVTTVTATPNLSANIRSNLSTAAPGEQVHVFLTVTNIGNAEASGVRVVVPAIEGGRVIDSEASSSVGSVELPASSIAVGQTKVFEWDVALDAAFPRGTSVVRPTGTVHAAGLHPIALDGAEIRVDASPRLQVELALEHDEARPGGTLIYVARYLNEGTAEATQVAVGLPFPERCSPIAELTSGTPDTVRRQVVVRVGRLAAGASGELRLGVRLHDAFPAGTTELSTVASVASAELDLVRSSPAVVQVAAAPDVAIAVQTASRTADPGGAVSFGVTCANRGSASAAGLLVSLILPDGVALPAATRDVAVDRAAREVSWSLGDLAPGKHHERSVALRLDTVFPVGESDLTITARALWDDGVCRAESSPVMVTAYPTLETDLHLAITEATPGQHLMARIHCRNTGNAAAPEGCIRLNLDESLAHIELEDQTSLQFGELAPGERVEIEVPITLAGVFPAGETLLPIEASSESRLAGRVFGMTSKAHRVRVHADPKLVIEATVDQPRRMPGETLAFKVDCVNRGNAVASDVQLFPQLAPGMMVVSTAGACADEDAHADVRWAAQSLGAGEVLSAAVVVRLADAYPAGETDVSSRFIARCGELSADVSSPELAVQVVALPEFSLTMAAKPQTCRAGGSFRVRLLLDNVGNAVAAGAVLTMRVPERTSFENASGGGHHDTRARLVSWELEPLLCSSEPLVHWVDLRSDPVFPHGNTALSIRGAVSSVHSSAECSLDDVVVEAAADVRLELTAKSEHPLPGEPVMYSISFHNHGTAAAEAVHLVNPLPPRSSFVSASRGGAYDEARNAVTWDLGSIGAGREVECVLTIRLDAYFPSGRTEIANLVMAEWSEGSSAVSEEHTLEVVALPVLRPRLELPAESVVPGGDVRIGVLLEAAGLVAASGLQLELVYPDFIEIQSVEGNGEHSEETSTIVWTPDALPPGESLNVAVRGMLASSLPAGGMDATVLVRTTCGELSLIEHRSKLRINAAPELVISLGSPQPIVRPEQPVSLQLDVENRGNVGAAGVVATIPLPSGFFHVDSETDERLDGTVRWELGELSAGARERREIPVVAETGFPSGKTRVAFVATVSSVGGNVDGALPVPVDVEAAPRLVFEVDASLTAGTAGETLSLPLLLSNRGDAESEVRQFSASLPAGFTLESIESQRDQDWVSLVEIEEGVWEMPPVPADTAQACRVSVRVNTGFPPGRTSHALLLSLRESEAEAEVGLSAAVEIFADVQVEGQLQLDLEGVIPGQSLPGQAWIENRGTAELVDAKLVVGIPSLLSIDEGQSQSVDGGHWSCPLESLLPGDNLAVALPLRVAPDLRSGEWSFALEGWVETDEGQRFELAPVELALLLRPQLHLSSEVTPSVSPPGGAVSVRIHVENRGNVAAQCLLVEDRLPKGCTFNAADHSGVYDDRTGRVRWELDELPPGECVLEWTGQLAPAFPVGATELSNEPVASAQEAVPTCSATTWIVQAANDVGVMAVPTPKVVGPGEPVQWLVRVGNAGVQETGTLEVNLRLPDELTSDGSVVWELPSIPAGSDVEHVIQSTVGTLMLGRRSLVGHVSVRSDDAVLASHDVELIGEVLPGLRLFSPGRSGPSKPGDLVDVVLECRPDGCHALGQVQMQLHCPPGAELISSSQGGELQEQGHIVWTLPNVNTARSARCQLRLPSADLLSGPSVEFRATAEIGGEHLIQASPVTLDVVVAPVLSTEARVVPEQGEPGDHLVLQIQLRNEGTGAASDALVHFELPSSLVVLGASEGHRLSERWSVPFGRVAAGESLQKEWVLRVDKESVDLSSTGVHVDVTCHESGRLDGPRETTAGLTLRSMLSSAVTAPAQPVTFRLALRNDASDAVSGVVVEDRVPQGWCVQDVSDGGEYLSELNLIRWRLDELSGAGGAVPLRWTGAPPVACPAGVTEYENAPVVHVSEQVLHGRAAVVLVESSCDFGLQLTPSVPLLSPGEPLVWTLRAGYAGSESEQAAVLTVTLPNGLSANAEDLIWPIDSLVPGQVYEHTFAAEVSGLSFGRTALTAVAQLVSEGLAPVTSEAVVEALVAPKLSLRVQAEQTPYHPSETFDCDLLLEPNGCVGLQDLNIWLDLAPGLEALEIVEGPGSLESSAARWRVPVLSETQSLRCRLRLPDKGISGLQSYAIDGFLRVGDGDVIEAESVFVEMVARPLLTFDVQVTPSRVEPNGELLVRLVCRNNGTAPATECNVVVPVPEGATAVTDGSAVAESLARFSMDTIDVGAECGAELHLKIKDGYGAGLTPVRTAAVLSAQQMETPLSAELRYEVGAWPRLSVEGSVQSERAEPGEVLEYVLCVQNDGHAEAKSLEIRDRVPETLRFETASDDGEYIESTGVLRWRFSKKPLAPQERRVVRWSARVGDTLTPGSTVIQNQPAACADDFEFVEARDVGHTVVAVAADVQVQLLLEDLEGEVLDAPMAAGHRFQANVVVSNEGTTSALDVNVLVRLPSHVEVCDELTDCDVDTQRAEIRRILSVIRAGGSTHWQIPLRIATPLPASEITRPVAVTVHAPGTDEVRTSVPITGLGVSELEVSLGVSRASLQPTDFLDAEVAYQVGGSADAEGIQATLNIPAGFRIETVLDGGTAVPTADGTHVRWTPGRFAVGDAGVLRCRLQVQKNTPNGTELPLSAVVSSTTGASVTTLPFITRVQAVPDLRVQMKASRDRARPGERVVYTLELANVGRASATDVVVSNPVPPDCQVGGVRGDGEHDELSGAVFWRFSELGPGHKRTMAWAAQLDERFPPGETPFVNLAVVEALDGGAEGGQLFAEAEIQTTVFAAPALDIRVSLDPPRTAPDQAVECVVEWANRGDARATQSRIELPLGDGIRRVDRADGGMLETRDEVVRWPLGTIEPGYSGRSVLRLHLQRSFPKGSTTLPVRLKLVSAESEEDTSATATLKVTAEPKLVLKPSVDRLIAAPGETTRIEFVWQNLGGAPASEGWVEVGLPSHVDVLATRPDCTVERAENRLRWSVGALEVGDEGRVSLDLQVHDKMPAGDTVLSLPVRLGAKGLSPVAEAVAFTVRAAPRLDSVLRVDQRCAQPGEVLTYQVGIRNTGDADATGAVMVLPLPERTEVASVTGAKGTFDAATRTLRVLLGTVPVGYEHELEVLLRLEPSFPDGESTLRVRARFDAHGSEGAWCEPVETVVRAVTDLAMAVSLDRTTAAPGDEIVASLSYANRGNAHARGLLMTLLLPEQVTLVDGVGGRFGADGCTLTWPAQNLDSGASGQCDVRFRLPGSFPAGTSECQIVAEASAETGAPAGASVPLWIQAAPQVMVALTLDPDGARPGQTVQLLATVVNEGNAEAESVNLSVWVGQRLEVAGLPDGAAWGAEPGCVAWSLGSVRAGAAVERTLPLSVLGEFPTGTTTLPLRASVSAEGATATGDALLQLSVFAAPVLEATISGPEGSASADQTLVYRLNWLNRGDACATGARILIKPAACTSVDLPPGALELGDLAPGMSGTVELPVRVAPLLPAGATDVSPLISVGARNVPTEPVEVPSCLVESSPQFDVRLSLDAMTVQPSMEFACVVDWSNAGNSHALNTWLEAVLPPGIDKVQMEDGRLPEMQGGLARWRLGTVEPGATGRSVLCYTLAPSFERGSSALRLDVRVSSDGGGSEESASVQVEAQPGLCLEVAVAQALASPGEVVPYELTWMNTGGALACDVQLEIPIPSGTRVVRTWPELALDGDANHVTWQLGDVEAGARGVVQLALRMESSRAGDTEVTLRPRLYGAELPALEDTVSVVVHAAPVLRARITVDERTVRPGALLTYRIHVANQGDGDASDLLLRLPLPERTDVVSVGGGQGTLDADARELNVPLGDLAPGESNDVELKVRLDSTFPSGESLLSLQAYFDSTGLDTTVTSEPIETIVTAVSDLAVSLTFGCTTARPGEEIEGLLQVVNRGNADVSRLLLHLHLPEGCTVVSADEGTGHPLAWEGLTLAAGQEAQRCVRFQLPQSFKAGTSELQMKAEAIPYGEEPFTVSAVLWVQATSDLRIELQALPGETRPGAEIKLRALVENHGDAPAEGVNASIWLPERLDLVGFEPEGLWDQVARRVHWTLGSVEPAGQVSCCALVRVSEAFPAGSSTLPVRASVEADHALATEDALTQIQVTAKAQLEANAEISVQSASPGDRVLIRVAWENVGDAPAHGARLFVQAAPNTRLDVDPVRLDLGTVPPGATGTLEIPVQLLKAFPAGVTNASPTITLGAGSLKGQALEVPSLMVTAASNIRVDVSSETSVAMASVESRVATQTSDGDDNEQAAQTQSEPMPVGADLKFTLTIVNKGNAPAQDTTITHDLPPGATFITASHGGRYVAASHAVVWELGTVRVDTPAVRTTVVRFGG